MILIKALSQKDYDTIDARRDRRQELSMTSIKTHRNYPTTNEKLQGKKKRIPSFVTFRSNLDSIQPQRNIFTSKGIIQNVTLQPLNKKVPNNYLTRYRKRDKNISLRHHQVPKSTSSQRAKTPKIHIKSIFSFRSSEKRQAKQLLPNNHQRPFKRLINYFYQPKRIHTEVPITKNQFIGWETQSNNNNESNL